MPLPVIFEGTPDWFTIYQLAVMLETRLAYSINDEVRWRAQFPELPAEIFRETITVGDPTPKFMHQRRADFDVVLINGLTTEGREAIEASISWPLSFYDTTLRIAQQVNTWLSRIVTALTPRLTAGKPVLFCGHSLGGAFAHMLGDYWGHHSTSTPVAAVSFGAPRLAERNRANDADVPHVRVINGPDPIPALLPTGWRSLGSLGQEVWTNIQWFHFGGAYVLVPDRTNVRYEPSSRYPENSQSYFGQGGLTTPEEFNTLATTYHPMLDYMRAVRYRVADADPIILRFFDYMADRDWQRAGRGLQFQLRHVEVYGQDLIRLPEDTEGAYVGGGEDWGPPDPPQIVPPPIPALPQGAFVGPPPPTWEQQRAIRRRRNLH